MSTTSLPTGTRAAIVTPRPAPVKPPVLASDILREEVAPIAPAQRAVRVWLALFAVAFALAAAARAFLGYGPPSPAVVSGSIATAVVAALGAVVPAPYAARASLAAVAAFVPLAMGARGEGPLAALGFEGKLHAWLGLWLVTMLPGALLFRARYRAFRAARVLLAVVLAAAIPELVLLGTGAALGGPLLVRVADGALVAATLTGFFGFMGEETTGGCNGWAALVIVVHAVRIGLRQVVIGDGAYGPAGYLVGALGVAVSSTLVAYAIFQLLAALLAREARKVDVHRIVGPSAEDQRMHSLTSETDG
jgi:hypothetical protein